MGSRKISFDPAARFAGERGLIAMKVSLCGPHSFDTSTLPPNAFGAGDLALDWKASGGLCARNWSLSHQVGFFESATANAGHEISATASAIFFIAAPPVVWTGDSPTRARVFFHRGEAAPSPPTRHFSDLAPRAGARAGSSTLACGGLAAGRSGAAGRSAGRAPAVLRAALRLALPLAGLVHGRRGDPLGGAGALPATLRAALDLLVLPLAFVAPGTGHSVSFSAGWRQRRNLCIRRPYATQPGNSQRGDRQGDELDRSRKTKERRDTAEPLVSRAGERIPDRVTGAKHHRGEERLSGRAQSQGNGPPHRLHGGCPPDPERQTVEELQPDDADRVVRSRQEQPSQRGAREAHAEERGKGEAPEEQRKGEQRDHFRDDAEGEAETRQARR